MNTTNNNSGNYKRNMVDYRDLKTIGIEEFYEYENLKKQKSISYKRHIAKTISYRLVSTGIGFAVVWTISGSITIGSAFGFAELVYKPIQYYIHERIWYKYIKYGLKK